ncbi:MAG: hypothetical protein K2Q03_05835 [Sphingobacteriaceae bacterium]|nr:hypothetical protein [Sphingobacteriaceae bacterium]
MCGRPRRKFLDERKKWISITIIQNTACKDPNQGRNLGNPIKRNMKWNMVTAFAHSSINPTLYSANRMPNNFVVMI